MTVTKRAATKALLTAARGAGQVREIEQAFERVRQPPPLHTNDEARRVDRRVSSLSSP
jgi:hypothetical protein